MSQITKIQIPKGSEEPNYTAEQREAIAAITKGMEKFKKEPLPPFEKESMKSRLSLKDIRLATMLKLMVAEGDREMIGEANDRLSEWLKGHSRDKLKCAYFEAIAEGRTSLKQEKREVSWANCKVLDSALFANPGVTSERRYWC